jgi:preprotein translocase subunit SecA
MTRLGLKEGEAIEHKWLNHTIERAQRKVEEHHFSIRKRTLQYDDVMNRQRSIIYDLRQDILLNEGAAHERILDIFNDAIFGQCEALLPSTKDSDPVGLVEWMARFPVACSLEECTAWAGKPEEAARELYNRVEAAYEAKCATEVPHLLPMLERMICLTSIDEEWQKFLASMDDLRRSVSLRGYGQRDPLVEYKREAFEMFTELMCTIKANIVRTAFRATTNVEAYLAAHERMQQVAKPAPKAVKPEAAPQPAPKPMGNFTVTVPGFDAPAPEVEEAEEDVSPTPQAPRPGTLEAFMQNARPVANPAPAAPSKIGRNDPCPCGSGKKFKVCCGR